MKGRKDFNFIRNIGVMGSGSGNGTTTVATALAHYYGKMNHRVCYTECKDPDRRSHLFYDSADMKRHFPNEEIISVYSNIKLEKPIRNLRNVKNNVNWRIVTPEDVENQYILTERERWELITSAMGDICVFDFESNGKWDNFISNMDLIILVIDPLPSKLIRDRNRMIDIQSLDNGEVPFFHLVNHMNDGVSKRQIKKYITGSNPLFIKSIDLEKVYALEFRCKPLWSDPEVDGIFANTFAKISENMVK